MRKNRVGRKKNGFSMFILDDDRNMTDALQSYFEASGYDVEQSNDPLEALEQMREKAYDILLLDFIMYPICGDEVVARLREFDTNIYVIMLTGHREVAPPLNTIRELEIQGYFEKSDRFDQLELLVESCIKSIRQMKTVSRYQEGLSNILEAVPKMHRYLPMPVFAKELLAELLRISGAENGFVWLKPENMLPGEDIEEMKKEIFCGEGRWKDDTLDTFLEKYPSTKICFQRRQISTLVEGERHFVLIPLNIGEKLRLGMMGIIENGENTEGHDLYAVFGEQAASALHNLILHHLLQLNNQRLQLTYEHLEKGYMDTIEALRLLIDAKDIYTRGHSDRVAYYAVRLAQALGKSREYVEYVRAAGLLHDIGKIGVSDAILKKEAKLDDKEFSVIKKHPEMGANILARISMFQSIGDVVAAHHERYDGTGYPKGLKGEEIPEEARIVAIADAFDAMMSDRHYRKKLTMEECIRELEEGMGTQFDSNMIPAFLSVLKDFDAMDQELRWTYQRGNII